MKLLIGMLLGICIFVSNSYGMSIEMFQKWAKADSGKTTTELVNGYDKLLCLAHRLLAEKMLMTYRGKTISQLRSELAPAQCAQKPAAAQKDDDGWPEL